MKANSLAALLHAFFHEWMGNQRNFSRHTVHSYRDTWKLLLRFVDFGRFRIVLHETSQGPARRQHIARLHHLHALLVLRQCRIGRRGLRSERALRFQCLLRTHKQLVRSVSRRAENGDCEHENDDGFEEHGEKGLLEDAWIIGRIPPRVSAKLAPAIQQSTSPVIPLQMSPLRRQSPKFSGADS